MSAASPSTFLELVQRTAMECGVSLTDPDTTTGQTGRLGQIVHWVNAAWLDIQTRHNDWKFLRASFSVDTTASDGKYAITDCTDVASAVALTTDGFRDWCRESFKLYLTSSGSGTETDLLFIDYQHWYERYNVGQQTDSYPNQFTIDHDMGILLAPKPDGIYTLRGEYMKAATAMDGDSDTPELPAEYRMAIVYRAMMKYGRYNGAPEVFNDGQSEYMRMMREVGRTQRPANVAPGALA